VLQLTQRLYRTPAPMANRAGLPFPAQIPSPSSMDKRYEVLAGTDNARWIPGRSAVRRDRVNLPAHSPTRLHIYSLDHSASRTGGFHHDLNGIETAYIFSRPKSTSITPHPLPSAQEPPQPHLPHSTSHLTLHHPEKHASASTNHTTRSQKTHKTRKFLIAP
jgi:hypothetical protein